MAIFAGTYHTYLDKGNREDLEDVIYRVTPSDTPVLTAIGRGKATATFHEWQTQALDAVDTTNARIEGDEFSYSAPTATIRVGNRTQILSKTWIISGTLDVVDKAGRDSEIDYQRVVQGLNLRRDLETMLVGKNAASLAGAAGTARISGSLSSWIDSAANGGNDNGTAGPSPANRGTGGAAGGFSTVTGLTVAATDGTTRAFTQAMLDGVVGRMYVTSGMVDDVVVFAGPSQKQVLTNFDGIAGTVFHETSDMTIIATADVYASQFGKIKIMPNRYFRQTASVDREVYLMRPSFAKLAVLRPMQEIVASVTGDAEKRVLITEATFQVSNQAAHAVVADLS